MNIHEPGLIGNQDRECSNHAAADMLLTFHSSQINGITLKSLISLSVFVLERKFNKRTSVLEAFIHYSLNILVTFDVFD